MIGIGVVYFTEMGLGRLRPDVLGMSVERRYVMNDMILCSCAKMFCSTLNTSAILVTRTSSLFQNKSSLQVAV